MIDFLTEPNHKLEKSAVRKTVLEATKLHQRGELDKATLSTIAASALAWEMSARLLQKCSKKLEKLDAKIDCLP